MADASFSERTEPATPKRLKEARDRGQVAKSQDITSTAVLIAGLAYLMYAGSDIMARFQDVARDFLSAADGSLVVRAGTMPSLFAYLAFESAEIIMPLAVVLMIVGLAANIGQFGFLLTFQPLQPKLGSLNPINGVKKLFGWRGLVEALKSILKFVVVGIFLYTFIAGLGTELLGLASCPLQAIPGQVAGLVLGIAWRIVAALVVLAIADLIWQRFDYKRNMKMSKQEVKDERKQVEGDEKTRARIRARQMQITRNRMFAEIPKANVVITNPVHVAVALRYEPGEMVAPQVVAKGARLMAERIKSIARQHGIPIIERPPLARLLWKSVRVGQTIPASLFQAVAEILAHVYRTRATASRSAASRPRADHTNRQEAGIHLA
jgi:flagellar biosynthetic protein FlhB